MSTTGISSGVFDELYIRDAQGNLTQVVGSGQAYDDSALVSAINANTSSITANSTAVASNTTAIAGKQDALTISTPLALNNNQLTFDATSTHLQVNQLTSQFDVNCGDLTANAIFGPAVTQIQNEIDSRITAANLEPSFDVSDGTLSKFSTTPGFPEMAISQAVMNRIAALEAAINPFFCAGVVDASSNTIISDIGRVSFSISSGGTGKTDLTFSTPASNSNFLVLLGSTRELCFYRKLNGTTNSITNAGFRVFNQARNGVGYDTLFSFAVIA